jgi:hypothetical protein
MGIKTPCTARASASQGKLADENMSSLVQIDVDTDDNGAVS